MTRESCGEVVNVSARHICVRVFVRVRVRVRVRLFVFVYVCVCDVKVNSLQFSSHVRLLVGWEE